MLVDFWDDTFDNLDGIVEASGLPRNELVRRGSEAFLVMFGVPKYEIGDILLESLKENERILSSRHVSKVHLEESLSKTVALSSALSALYVVNEGKEQASVLRIYFNTIQGHLSIISQEDFQLRNPDISTIREDVRSFANILSKILTQSKSHEISSLRQDKTNFSPKEIETNLQGGLKSNKSLRASEILSPKNFQRPV